MDFSMTRLLTTLLMILASAAAAQQTADAVQPEAATTGHRILKINREEYNVNFRTL